MFENIIHVAIDNAQGDALMNDNDYYAPCFDDEPELEVLYCGVCGCKKEFYPYISTTAIEGNRVPPKEYRRYFSNGNDIRKVTVKCKCEQEGNKRDKHKSMLRQKAVELKRSCWGYRNDDGIMISNRNIEQVEFDKYESNKHIRAAEKYLENLTERFREHKGITLLGKAGSGKTTASMCLANALMDKGIDVQFRQQFQITSLSQFNNSDEIELLQRCSVLFIDDLSLASLTEYGEEILFNLIELRIQRGLITCYSSNLTAQKITNPPATSKRRLYDRIAKTTYLIDDSTHNYRQAEHSTAQGVTSLAKQA